MSMVAQELELEQGDHDMLCDALLQYDCFERWFYTGPREDSELLLRNLLDKADSRLKYIAGYTSLRDQLMSKYACDERTLVTTVVLSYAGTSVFTR